jgi:hypothetical protein
MESMFNRLEECHKKTTNTWKLTSSSGFTKKMVMSGLIFVGMDRQVG